MTAAARCSVDGCDRPVLARGWCSAHYQRWWAHGDPEALLPHGPKPANLPCSIDGCDRLAVARGWCNMHYQRWRRTRALDGRS